MHAWRLNGGVTVGSVHAGWPAGHQSQVRACRTALRPWARPEVFLVQSQSQAQAEAQVQTDLTL